MYCNLAPTSLDVSCRQSELIELALTYGFGGLDLNLQEFQTQVESKGLDAAARLLKSARVKLNGGELPVELSAVEGKFESQLQMAQPLLETAQSLGVQQVQAILESGNPQRPYHENFEFHRQRLERCADALDSFGLRLGLSFLAPAYHREAFAQPFVSKPDEMVTLVKLVGRDNIGMVVDLWHWAVAGGSLDLLADVSPAQITEVRLADVPDGVEPASAQDNQRTLPRPDGSVHCVQAMTRLAEMEYRGAVTVAPDASQLETSKREDIIKATVAAHESIMTAAGLDNRGRLAPAAAASESPQ